MADPCDCGRIIEQPATGRRRRKCLVCSPQRDRPARKAPVLAMASSKSKRDLEQSGSKPTICLTDRTRTELERTGRLDTWQGDAALKLALLVDDGGYTAQGAAALVKAHREALDLALAGGQADADVIDLIFGDGGA